MASRSAAIWITVDGDRQSATSNDSSPACADGSVASASSAPTRSAWPRGSQVTASRASSRRRRASASLAFMVAPRGAERPPATRRTVWPATCASSVRSSRRATGRSVPQRQPRSRACRVRRMLEVSRPVRDRRISEMTKRLRYNSTVRRPAAVAALLGAVMVGAGLRADAPLQAQAPARPPAAASPTPTPRRPRRASCRSPSTSPTTSITIRRMPSSSRGCATIPTTRRCRARTPR